MFTFITARNNLFL